MLPMVTGIATLFPNWNQMSKLEQAARTLAAAATPPTAAQSLGARENAVRNYTESHWQEHLEQAKREVGDETV